jgi:hypothetical protein
MSDTPCWPPSNPFATRHVRPGALPYLFPPGESAAGLLERLQAHGWWGQVVGPHGSGKSTLLAVLLAELRQLGRAPMLITLHDGQRRLPAAARRALRDRSAPGRTIVVVDGYEQLRGWSRLVLKYRCRRRGCGLLITAHSDVGLPGLYDTRVTPATAANVIQHLLPPGTACPLSPTGLAARLTARDGNLREVLFDLYDWYERQRGQAEAGNSAPD